MNRREFLAGGIAYAAGLCLPFNRSFSQTVHGIELFLFLDWSDSMYVRFSNEEGRNYITQRDGHIAALRDKEIQKVLISQKIFVRVILWAGGADEIISIFAGPIETLEDLSRLMSAISKKVPDYSSPTGLTDHFSPLAYAESVPLSANRRIIDISTDQEIKNLWIADLCRKLKDKLNRKMMTEINVLAINVGEKGGKILSKNLLTPKGFMMGISGWGEYITAIKRKLKKELGVV